MGHRRLVVILLGLSVGRNLVGGDFVNDYTVPGSESADGLDVLDSDFSGASGYSGQIVFHAGDGKKVSSQQSAVKKAIGDIRNLDHVIKATDPLSQQGTPEVSKDGTIAYSSVSWDVVPASLDESYLDDLDDAVQAGARRRHAPWSTAAAPARSVRHRTTRSPR